MRQVLLLFIALSLSAEEWLVAPNGNDQWSGHLATPNAAKTDGPFATLARAQLAVRAANTTDLRIVTIRGGRYEFTAPLVFTAEDSGTATHPVTWRAATDETPIISGGVRLSGFVRDANGRWTLTIPAVHKGEWTFRQLWVNGERRFRPRLPKDGYHVIEAELPASEAAQGKGFDRFRYAAGAFDPAWKNQRDIEVLTFHQWAMSRFRIQSIAAESRTVQFTGRTISNADWSGLKTGWRYLIENVAEAFGTPGEWYLDPQSGVLTYIPLPGEDLATAEIIAPRTEQLLRIEGDPSAGKIVEHLRFSGLTFAHTQWALKPEGYSFYQAEMVIPATVVATGLRDASFSGCAIVHTGGYGLELGRGCKRVELSGCLLTDLSAGGIKIGEGGIHQDDNQVASHNTVRDCLITNGGRVHPAGIGVWIGQSHHNSVEHCEISDLYYSSLSLGWTWGYGPSLGHHNTVAWCHLHHIGQGVLSDMGGIYNLGVSPGTVFHHNHIHDIESFSYGGWGLYTDEGSSNVTMEHNLVHHTTSSGFHQHYGRDNLVRNNVFAYGGEAQVMRTRDEDHLSFTLERNILLANGRPLLGSNWNGDAKKFVLNRNVYWDEDGSIDFAGKPFDEWKKKGIDAESVVADPQFSDPAKGDFSLKTDSPALALGFQPLDLRAAGVRREQAKGSLTAWLAKPRTTPRVFPPKPAK
jgi:Right handed beta helix region